MAAPRCIAACLTDPLTNSNCYILTHQGHALIIDPNRFAPIQTYLTEHNVQPEYVFLTHEHCDHMAGLNELRQTYSLQVVASQACSDGIQSTTLNMTRMMEAYLYFKSQGTLRVTYPKFTCAKADIIFHTFDLFFWYDHHFLFVSAPGHTPGSTCIIMDDTVLFSGDYFIPGEDVITRLPGGDEETYQNLGKEVLRALPVPLWTYPGHGPAFMLTEEVKRHYGL